MSTQSDLRLKLRFVHSLSRCYIAITIIANIITIIITISIIIIVVTSTFFISQVCKSASEY